MYSYRYLEMFPRELRYLTALKSLYISAMPATFESRIKVIDGVEGEDFNKFITFLMSY